MEANKQASIDKRIVQYGKEISDAFSKYEVKEVILYGSRSIGNFSPESDIDLCVITQKEVHWKKVGKLIDKLQTPYLVSLEIHVYSESKLKQELEYGNSALRDALKGGRILYPKEQEVSKYAQLSSLWDKRSAALFCVARGKTFFDLSKEDWERWDHSSRKVFRTMMLHGLHDASVFSLWGLLYLGGADSIRIIRTLDIENGNVLSKSSGRKIERDIVRLLQAGMQLFPETFNFVEEGDWRKARIINWGEYGENGSRYSFGSRITDAHVEEAMELAQKIANYSKKLFDKRYPEKETVGLEK
jgi:predicted nucleotidyltransferase